MNNLILAQPDFCCVCNMPDELFQNPMSGSVSV